MSRARHFSHSRLLCLLLSLSGTVTNSVVAFNIISLARSLRWEVVESEWESSYISWPLGIDSIKLVWAILSFYFVICALICSVGFIGVYKCNLSFVKLYRDYSLINLSISAFATIMFALATFRVSVRTSICEELTRHPELLPDLAEAGLDMENCEPWLEKASLAIVAIMAVLLVVRLQFTLAVTSYLSQLSRSVHRGYIPLEDSLLSDSERRPSVPRRIFLLPSRSNSAPSSGPNSDEAVVVYAPVPLSSLSPQETHDLDAAEAWYTHSTSVSGSSSRRRQGSLSKNSQSPTRHGRSHVTAHHRRHSSSHRIKLPLSPDEPLLPEYNTLVQNPKQEV